MRFEEYLIEADKSAHPTADEQKTVAKHPLVTAHVGVAHKVAKLNSPGGHSHKGDQYDFVTHRKEGDNHRVSFHSFSKSSRSPVSGAHTSADLDEAITKAHERMKQKLDDAKAKKKGA